MTAVARVQQALEAAESEGKRLNAFITTMPDRALARAEALDRETGAGKNRGPLHGVPVAVKDLFYTAGVRTTGGTKVFADFIPSYDATVVTSLEEAGAVIIGKTNLHELAYGITSNNPHYGAVHNPRKYDCIPGGSSGGSGAVVAAGIVPIAMGTDTGGSIRIPAAYCGTVGLKPTYGLVSRYGCQALGMTLDHMGPLAATVHDCAIAMNALTGRGDFDEYASDLNGVRIGWPVNFYLDAMDPAVRVRVEHARDAAVQAGASVHEVQVPDIAKLNTVARVILMCEASALMQKHLGRREDFGLDVLALLEQGLLLPGVDYVNAQRARQAFVVEFDALFEKIDCLFTPTTPITAPPIGATTVQVDGNDEDARLASTRLVRGINVIGYPAISLPCGEAHGLPVGLQIVGRPFEDALPLRVAAAIEKTMASPGVSPA